VLDLSGVTDADTKLVAALVAALRRARAASVKITIIVSTTVYNWISVCRVDRFLAPLRVEPDDP
jgi:anti-anti-sigma regulatory factor